MQKNIEMSYNQAAQIASDMLDIFQFLFGQYQTPIRLNLWSEEQIDSDGDSCPEIVYSVIQKEKARHFELRFYDDPDILGYCSMLQDYDPSTYVICEIVEKRADKSKKYEFTFGFDIQKRTFLELFELTHKNTVGITRSYPNLNCRLENELKDVVIIL